VGGDWRCFLKNGQSAVRVTKNRPIYINCYEIFHNKTFIRNTKTFHITQIIHTHTNTHTHTHTHIASILSNCPISALGNHNMSYIIKPLTINIDLICPVMCSFVLHSRLVFSVECSFSRQMCKIPMIHGFVFFNVFNSPLESIHVHRIFHMGGNDAGPYVRVKTARIWGEGPSLHSMGTKFVFQKPRWPLDHMDHH